MSESEKSIFFFPAQIMELNIEEKLNFYWVLVEILNLSWLTILKCSKDQMFIFVIFIRHK